MHAPFTRTVLLGTVDIGYAHRAKLFGQVRYGAMNGRGRDGELSITGVEGPMANGDCRGGCGQLDLSYGTAEARAGIDPATGWDAESIAKFFDIWGRWHLNGMRAGSPAQMEHLRTLTFPGHSVSHWDWTIEQLRAARLQPDKGYLHGTPPKPYSYGSAWLTEEVPDEVLAWLEALPEADIPLAWA